MASSVIGALRVNLGLDSAQFSKGVKKSQTEMEKFRKQMAKVGAALSVVSTGIALGVRKNLNAADEMGKMAQKIGLSVEEMSRFSHAADMSGVKIGDLENGIRRLSRNMVDTPKMFEELGIAVRNSDGTMRDTKDVIDDFADILAKMPDGAEKTALAFDVMGRSGSALIPMLNGGAAGLAQMKAEADSLGIVFSEETFKNAEAFNDNISRLQKQFGGLGTIITAQLAPILLKVSDYIVEAMMAFRNLSPETQKIIGIIAGVTAVIGPLTAGLGLAALAIGPLVAGVVALAGPVGLAVSGITALGAGALYLYNRWDELTAQFPILQTALDTILPPLRRISEILVNMGGAALQTLISGFSAVAALLRGDFSGAMEHGRSITENVGRSLSGLAEIATIAIDALTGGMATGMIDLSRKAVGWAVDIVNSIIEGLGGLYEAGVDAIKNLGAGITGGLISAKNGLVNAGKGLVNWIRGGVEDEAEIKSPSKLFHRLGEQITQGFANGIASGQGMVSGAIGDFSDGMQEISASAQNAFASVINGSRSVKGALSDLLDSLSRVALNQTFRLLLGGGPGSGGGVLGSLFGSLMGSGGGMPSFAGGGFTGAGMRSGGIDGRGGFPAILHPNESVIDHTRGGGGGGTTINVNVSGVNGDNQIREAVAAGVRQGIGIYDKRMMPVRMRQVSNDPRRVG